MSPASCIPRFWLREPSSEGWRHHSTKLMKAGTNPARFLEPNPRTHLPSCWCARLGPFLDEANSLCHYIWWVPYPDWMIFSPSACLLLIDVQHLNQSSLDTSRRHRDCYRRENRFADQELINLADAISLLFEDLVLGTLLLRSLVSKNKSSWLRGHRYIWCVFQYSLIAKGPFRW